MYKRVLKCKLKFPELKESKSGEWNWRDYAFVGFENKFDFSYEEI